MAEQQRRILTVGSPYPGPAKRRLSLTDQVYEQLKDDILETRCAPGDVLVEPELAERYGVSKTPVREALRLLVQDDWVIVMPRKGYLVRPVRLDDIREIFEIRHMIEPAMAARAAQGSSETALEGLAALCSEQSASDGGVGPPLRAARSFHLELAALGKNRRASAVLSRQLDEVRRMHHLMPRVEPHITSTIELAAHRDVLDAVHGRDAEQARRLMAQHLTEVGNAMVEAFVDVHR
ncbi:DNA-binding GntR family transcriptional regulator [Streptomyces aurantiacus]|uniref:GntR family transcriptional regulator n=1 Tax=Streptomyces aurantiacus TaxID=47760 RepID=UPI0027917119|nr:GntR family transcriptional regulator [Streptomyces aurantiacus]MDQ0772803.1 DNA-binding GntR family transcriptional regulator [Streptomyces aurantiacus]